MTTLASPALVSNASATTSATSQPHGAKEKLEETMDKIKKQIVEALNLDTKDAQPRTRALIESELERARLNNQWDKAQSLAEELIALINANTATNSQSHYTSDESLSLAHCVLAQSALTRYELTSAIAFVDKAHTLAPHFMDALYLRATIELLKPLQSLQSPRHSNVYGNSRRSPSHSRPASPRNGNNHDGGGETILLNAANPLLPTTTITSMHIPSLSPSNSSNTLLSPSSAQSSVMATNSSPFLNPNTLSVSDRTCVTLALGHLSRYHWQTEKHHLWQSLDSRKKFPYRFRLLLELVLTRAKLDEVLGHYADAYQQYTQIIALITSETTIANDLQLRLLFALSRMPRMLLLNNRRVEALNLMRQSMINAPSNYSSSMIVTLRRVYASLILRAYSASEFVTINAVNAPVTFNQESLLMLVPSGSTNVVYTPLNPPSLYWHPFSPISLSHGSSSHAIYLSHSPVPLPVNTSAAGGNSEKFHQSMRRILSIDYSLNSATALSSDDRDAYERETCLALSRGKEFVVLAEMYRTLLSTQLESPQLWYKLAIALLSAKQYNEAYLAITECLNRAPDYVMALLMAGKLCLNFLDKPKEAVTYAARALSIAEQTVPVMTGSMPSPLTLLRDSITPPKPSLTRNPSSSTPSSPRSPRSPTSRSKGNSVMGNVSKPVALKAPPSLTFTTYTSNQLTLTTSVHASLLLSCQILYGIACSKYAYVVSTFSNRKALQKRALSVLQLAYKSSPYNHKVLFSLACLYADIREIGMALSLLKQCLTIDRTHIDSWNLLALLLSAQKKYDEAIRACEDCVKQRGSINGTHSILLTRSRLYGELGLIDEACRSYLELSTMLFPNNEFAIVEVSKGRGRRPVFRNKLVNKSDSDKVKISNVVLNIDDPIVNRCETLIALASLYSDHYSRTHDAVYLRDAVDAINYCDCIAPATFQPMIHAQRAQLALLSNRRSDALNHFEQALAIDSTHSHSLIGLAAIFSANTSTETNTGSGSSMSSNLVLAYGYLTQALQMDATDHMAWHAMGQVLVKQGRGDEAVDQFITAAELERSAPIVSFSTIQRRV